MTRRRKRGRERGNPWRTGLLLALRLEEEGGGWREEAGRVQFTLLALRSRRNGRELLLVEIFLV